jgi:hypothetical protein
MHTIDFSEDRIWQSVLEALSAGGRFSRFQKLSPSELRAVVRHCGTTATRDMYRLFSLTQKQLDNERRDFLSTIDEPRAYSILYTLIRSMKCWVESESPVNTVRGRWKVAHG